ncbi:MAG: 4Fe-4S binding protein [Promethearchaeia archaeon]
MSSQEDYKESTKGECYFCGRCIDFCPQDAIKLKK